MILTINEDTTSQEIVEQIVAKSLRETYEMLNQPQCIPVFSGDPKEEAKELKKFLKAIRKVHNWYTMPEDHL